MILYRILKVLNVVLEFYCCIFIRLFECDSLWKFVIQINFFRYRAPMETSLEAKRATLCK